MTEEEHQFLCTILPVAWFSITELYHD